MVLFNPENTVFCEDTTPTTTNVSLADDNLGKSKYIDFTSAGVGTHTFNYPSISVKVVGEVGISSVGTETFECKVQPIFRGEITSIHLIDQGVGYGSSEIINFNISL